LAVDCRLAVTGIDTISAPPELRCAGGMACLSSTPVPQARLYEGNQALQLRSARSNSARNALRIAATSAAVA
jgi:hypothetical protein